MNNIENISDNFALDKTNVRLTGNIKLVIDTNNDWYFESIDSSKLLETQPYKGYKYNKNFSYLTNLRNFVNNTSNYNLYDVFNSKDLRHSNEVYNQYHNLYDFGCYSEESQIIDENMRFFAPFYITDNNKELPKLFVVMKTDNVENTLDEKIKNGKVVEVFDLENINSQVFKKLQDCYITTNFKDTIVTNGLNINIGQYQRIEDYGLKSFRDNEYTITEFDNWITNSYKRNDLVFTNIVNLEFAFTDVDADGKFMKYFGFYCTPNELDDTVKIEDFDYGLKLMNVENGWIQYDKTYTLGEYLKDGNNYVGSSFGHRKQGVLELNFLKNPRIGSTISFYVDDKLDYVLTIKKEHLSKDIRETKFRIIQEINTNYQGENSSITAHRIDDKIRLITDNVLFDYGSLSVEISSDSLFIVNNNLYGDTTNLNNFVFPHEKTITTKAYINKNEFDYISYINPKTNERVYNRIVDAYRYVGSNFYILEDDVLNLDVESIFWVAKTVKEKHLVCSIFDTYELDMNTEITNYSNLSDYDLNQYREYLIDTVNSSYYYGNILEFYEGKYPNVDVIPQSEVRKYKESVNEIINSYFSNVQNNENRLIKNINTTDFSYDYVNNEYDRLRENSISQFRSYNRLYPFISKWSGGKDGNNNPNRLNVSLTFGEESFTPSQYIHRSKFNNTHDYFVVGEGVPSYITDDKVASYTKLRVTNEMFYDKNYDAYEFLTHEVENSIVKSYSVIKYDDLHNVSMVDFRGVKYSINKNLNGYKFSVVLKTSELVQDNDFDVEFIQNDTFKTFTIFIRFYVADLVLTTVERDDDYYFMDKSLMYYSNDDYSTVKNSVYYGRTRISLDLYNNTTIKKYLNRDVTNDFVYKLPNNQNIYFVGRGNFGIFSTSLTDILSIGDNLSIQHYYENMPDDDKSMVIEFVDIVEITQDYFWCKNIIVTTYDDKGKEKINNFDTEYKKQGNNVFIKNNDIYISKAISRESATYNKIINNKSNEARFGYISLNGIKTYLNGHTHKTNNGDFINVNIFNKETSNIVINYENINNEIVSIKKPYKFKIARQNVKYYPHTKVLQSYYNTEKFKSIFSFDSKPYKQFNKIISKVTQEYLDTQNSEITQIPKFGEQSKIYSYIKNANNEILNVKLPWLIAPNEVRNFKESIVLNTNEKIYFTYIEDNEFNKINLSKMMFNYIQKVCGLKNLTINDMVNFYNIYEDVSKETVNEEEVLSMITQKFITNILTKIYRLESIIADDGEIIDGYVDGKDILLEKNVTNKILNITFTR